MDGGTEARAGGTEEAQRTVHHRHEGGRPLAALVVLHLRLPELLDLCGRPRSGGSEARALVPRAAGPSRAGVGAGTAVGEAHTETRGTPRPGALVRTWGVDPRVVGCLRSRPQQARAVSASSFGPFQVGAGGSVVRDGGSVGWGVWGVGVGLAAFGAWGQAAAHLTGGFGSCKGNVRSVVVVVVLAH